MTPSTAAPPSPVPFFEALHTPASAIPPEVRHRAKLWLLDLLGVAAAAEMTDMGRLAADHAVAYFAPGPGAHPSALLFDGRRASPPGVALAGGTRIDSFDAHDGVREAKGHIGCSLLPGLLALVGDASQPLSGRDFLTLLVLGYEFGSRLGQALRATAPDYHSSGAWTAVMVAAVGSRLLGLSHAQARHALGIAEYHGPRGLMMRVVDNPTMVKDGAGWGAMAGVSAVHFAKAGFTGAPALTVEDTNVTHFWRDFGSRWYTLEQYFKHFPVCHWGQSSVRAVLELRERHALTSEMVDKIEVRSFHNNVRLAQNREPGDTEQAQYSSSFATAAAMVRGGLTGTEVSHEAFKDEEILRLSKSMVFVEEEWFTKQYPDRRLSQTTLHLRDGRRLESGVTEAKGDSDSPATEQEFRDKFHRLAGPVLGAKWAASIERMVDDIENMHDVQDLIDLVTRPVKCAS